MADDITWDNLWSKMVDAAKTALGRQPQQVKLYLEAEGKKLATTLKMIADGVVSKDISQDESKILLNGQKVAAQAVLTSSAGMSAIMAQAAINAALDVAKTFINGKIGFPLL